VAEDRRNLRYGEIDNICDANIGPKFPQICIPPTPIGMYNSTSVKFFYVKIFLITGLQHVPPVLSLLALPFLLVPYLFNDLHNFILLQNQQRN